VPETDNPRHSGIAEREYTVLWTIELTAASPRAAALQAVAIQRDWRSNATVFDVRSDDGQLIRVDLADPEADSPEPQRAV